MREKGRGSSDEWQDGPQGCDSHLALFSGGTWFRWLILLWGQRPVGGRWKGGTQSQKDSSWGVGGAVPPCPPESCLGPPGGPSLTVAPAHLGFSTDLVSLGGQECVAHSGRRCLQEGIHRQKPSQVTRCQEPSHSCSQKQQPRPHEEASWSALSPRPVSPAGDGCVSPCHEVQLTAPREGTSSPVVLCLCLQRHKASPHKFPLVPLPWPCFP